MRSLGTRDGTLGNLKLKGKRTALLPCGCCRVEDVKERHQRGQSRRETIEMISHLYGPALRRLAES